MKNKITVVGFLVLLYGLSFLNLINPQLNFSVNENRYLQMFPQVSLETIADGKFSDDFELWVQDQFVFRDEFIILKALANMSILKLENNAVYIGKDHYLFNKFINDDVEILHDNLKSLESLNSDIILIPSGYAINKDKLNPYCYNTNQKAILDNLNIKGYISVYDALSADDYFKTDHHLDMSGAYNIYLEYVNNKGLIANKYTLKKVSDDFKGTLYSKSGLFFYPGEEIHSVEEISDLNVKVIYDKSVTMNSLINEERLAEKDKYTYFLDGNHSLVEIDNLDVNDNSHLLVLNDSYGHIIVPLLVPHFDKISVIDLRYYRDEVSKYIKENNIENILAIYGLENLMSDTSLRLLR